MEIKYQKLVYMQINLFILYYLGTESKLKTKEELYRSVKTVRIPLDSDNGIVSSHVTKNFIQIL